MKSNPHTSRVDIHTLLGENDFLLSFVVRDSNLGPDLTIHASIIIELQNLREKNSSYRRNRGSFFQMKTNSSRSIFFLFKKRKASVGLMAASNSILFMKRGGQQDHVEGS